MTVSEGAAKSAASELGTDIEAAAKTLGSEFVRASKPYEQDLLAQVHELTVLAKELIQSTREMPRAFGEAVTDRLAKEESFRRALGGFAVLARSPEHLASAVEKGPYVLSTKLEALQSELSKEDGFLTQQRNALFDSVRKEREALTDVIHQERAEAVKDFDALTKHTIDEIFTQATRLVESSLWLLIGLAIVLWGLPFAAGFIAGRVVGRKRSQ
ncbi:MAG TPA: hypothetical protein VJR03_07950 [Nitrospira sp.]|nr:hypothetical protein [Nitrospira sp.]